MSKERREYSRYTVRWNAQVALEQPSIIHATVINISASGISFQCKTSIPVGAGIFIEFWFSHQKETIKIQATGKIAFRSAKTGGQGPQMGAIFTKINEEDNAQLNAVLARLEESTVL